MTEQIQLKRSELPKLLQSIKEHNYHKIFVVYFVKKNGEQRKLVGRFGVTKYLKGGKLTVNPKEFFTIYDMIKHGYRNVNKETIYKLQFDGTVYYCGES